MSSEGKLALLMICQATNSSLEQKDFVRAEHFPLSFFLIKILQQRHSIRNRLLRTILTPWAIIIVFTASKLPRSIECFVGLMPVPS